MLNFQVDVPLIECIPAVTPLLHAHYMESCNFKDLAGFVDPDWGKYEAIEAQGNLVTVLACLPTGEVMGYTACFLADHPHYKGVKTAWNDVIYLLPGWRDGMAGGRLMKATASACKERGAILLNWHAKPDTPLDFVLSKRKTSPLFERVYAQRL